MSCYTQARPINRSVHFSLVVNAPLILVSCPCIGMSASNGDPGQVTGYATWPHSLGATLVITVHSNTCPAAILCLNSKLRGETLLPTWQCELDRQHRAGSDLPKRSQRATGLWMASVAYPGIFSWGGGGSTNSVEVGGQRKRGSGGGRPLVRGSGDSCNLVQEIPYATYYSLFIFLQSAWVYLFRSLFLFLRLCSWILLIVFALASVEFDYFVTDVFSTELGIRLSFVKTSEFRGGGRGRFEPLKPPPPRYANGWLSRCGVVHHFV
jgi:hypothetical protein